MAAEEHEQAEASFDRARQFLKQANDTDVQAAQEVAKVRAAIAENDGPEHPKRMVALELMSEANKLAAIARSPATSSGRGLQRSRRSWARTGHRQHHAGSASRTARFDILGLGLRVKVLELDFRVLLQSHALGFPPTIRAGCVRRVRACDFALGSGLSGELGPFALESSPKS